MSERRSTINLGKATPQPQRLSAQPATHPQPNVQERALVLRQLRLTGAGSVFATLSPSHPNVSDRAALVFQRPAVVESGAGYAWWRDREVPDPDVAPEERVLVWFKSEATVKRYLVDAVVNGGMPQHWGIGGGKQCPFRASGPGLEQTFEVDAGGGHVAFVTETPASAWRGYSITAPEPSRFTFWYCEITRL